MRKSKKKGVLKWIRQKKRLLKKSFSAVLSAAMVLCFATVSFASNGDPPKGEEYVFLHDALYPGQAENACYLQ